MYQLSYKSCGEIRHTNPQPSFGLALKDFFHSQANYTLRLDWVNETHHLDTFTDCLWFESSKAMEEGRFSIKLIQVGNTAQFLYKDSEKNGGVFEAMNRLSGEEKLDVHVIQFQLHQVSPISFLKGGEVL